ncbi:MAG TPA: HAD-IC family P-type ATPase, partial [Gemmataceae bacterium]|nr:HAD-IC family P-type ATPase [Gemmataceae bacterium]
MPTLPGNKLVQGIRHMLVKPASMIHVSPELIDAAEHDPAAVLQKMQCPRTGLTQEEAARRRAQYGANVVAQEQHYRKLILLGKAMVNPLVILLLILAAISYATGDVRAAIVMLIMVALGVLLRFIQEARADTAAAKLKAMINVTATVVRDGKAREVPLADLVPGDLVRLCAGDMIPADLRVLSCKDLFVIQASITGESFPVEKFEPKETTSGKSPLELTSVCFLGTSVESGSAEGVIVATGLRTFLGSMSTAIVGQTTQTSFDRGIKQFTWLMIRFILVMVPLVFLINGITKQDWKQAFFFAMAVAVGLTPEMLPMIVTVCLSKGAIAMSRKKVIVKQLNSIQNLGAMDVLCTDKTGTLTQDRIILEKHCDVVLQQDESVLLLAYLNSHFQTGLKNVMDRAILQHVALHEQHSVSEYTKVDEIPFDFSRRVMSVVVKTPDNGHRLICKGAPEEIFKRCRTYELDGQLYPIQPVLLQDLRDEYERLSAEGFRVLALAYKDLALK